jgi:ADP-heptose:LPS heptosyltransferase
MMPLIPPAWQAARTILAVRLDNLGDVLVTTPAIHAIKASLPETRVTLLASPVGAQVARLNPDIADVIEYAAPWIDPWQTLPRDSAREQQMIAALRDRHFDGAIIFTSYHQSPLPAAYQCYLADIPLRVAASVDGSGSLLTTRHKHAESLMHEVERNLELVGVLGLTTTERSLVLRVPASTQKAIQHRMAQWTADRNGRLTEKPGNRHSCLSQSDHPLVVVHPGCTMPARTYPWEQFAQVIDLLVADLGAMVAVTGAADEADLVTRILDRLAPQARAATHGCAGDLPFPELCALIQAADLVITNNTGPMHIAAAVQTPVVALFALTNPPEQWGPWQVPHRLLFHDVECRICYSRVCPRGHECLRLVSPAMVLAAARELLAAPVVAQQEAQHGAS